MRQKKRRQRQRRTDRFLGAHAFEVGELGPTLSASRSAGVAAAVILGYRTDESVKTPPAQVAVVEQAVPSGGGAVDDEMRLQSVLQRSTCNAHAYMLHHAHHVALNNRSVVPFVKVAAFESTK
jgi:hypothetical protein